MRRNSLTTGVIVILAMLAAGCSSKADSANSAPGVTDSTITVGALTDLSGPIAVLGKPILQGNQLYVDEVNDNGGVCGRKIELEVRDHGYDVQKAVSAYTEIEPEVLGLVQLHGSAITAALGERIASDELLTVPASLASSLLANPSLIVPGATYDVQAVSILDHLVSSGAISEGDVVGMIYLEGEAGEDALKGAEWATERLSVNLKALGVDPTAVDVTSQMSTLKSAGARAVVVVTGPRPVASAASVAKSIGYDVPIITVDPGFHPSVMETSAAAAMEEGVLVFSSTGPISGATEAAEGLREAHAAKFPDEPLSAWVSWGYVTAQVYVEALQAACDDGDLTRETLSAAIADLDTVESDGLFPPLDFSQAGRPSSTQVYIGRPNAEVPGGLETEKAFFSTALADEYLSSAE